jgi:hypothetical protein
VKDLLLHALIWFDGSYREDLKVTFETLRFIFFSPFFLPFLGRLLSISRVFPFDYVYMPSTLYLTCGVLKNSILPRIIFVVVFSFDFVYLHCVSSSVLDCALTISFFLSPQLVCQKVSRDFGCVRVMLVSNTSRKIFPLV